MKVYVIYLIHKIYLSSFLYTDIDSSIKSVKCSKLFGTEAGLSANLVPRVCHFRQWPLAIASTGKIMMIDIERLLREIKPVLHPLRMQEIQYANTYFSVKFQQESAPLFFIRFKKKEYAKTVAGVFNS